MFFVVALISNAQSHQSYFLSRVRIDSLVPSGNYVAAIPFMRVAVSDKEMVTIGDEFLFGYALFKAGKIDSAAMFLKKALQNGYHFNALDHYNYWKDNGVFERMNAHEPLKDVGEILLKNTTSYLNPAIDSSLRQQLLTARESDQRYRKNNNYKKQKLLDKQNQKFLRKIIATYGWPTKDMVGWDGSNVAFLIAQHSDNDGKFQQMCLQYIHAAYYANKVDFSQYAYIIDRTRVNSGKPQLFGTQYHDVVVQGKEDLELRPIEDPVHLDIRRKAFGLQPISEYMADSRKHYLK